MRSCLPANTILMGLNVKAVILAGGLGTRLAEETTLKPKPMVGVGGRPILWHIMKIYAAHGVTDFIVCCGYKGYLIKEYFANYFLHQSDVTICMKTNSLEVHQRRAEPWTVTLVDTGDNSMTGGRLRRVKEYVENEDMFCMTYGDGLISSDIRSSIDFHSNHGRLATVTAVYPPGRFGSLELQGDQVVEFKEKPKGDGAMVNGGFFVMSPEALNYIDGDLSVWEEGPLNTLARENQLRAFRHEGFWQPMDTLRDKLYLQRLWDTGSAPWMVWDD